MEKEIDFYREIVKNAPMAYALHKLLLDDSGAPADYVFLDVNEAFERMTGLTYKQVINKTVSEAIPGIKEGDFDWIDYYGKLTLNRNESKFIQYSEPLKRWYNVYAFSPASMHFVTLFFDISQEKSNQENLYQLKQKLDSVVNTQKEFICRFKPDTTIVFVNDAFCRVFNKTADELLGKSLLELVSVDQAKVVLKNIESIQQQKKPFTHKNHVTTANNERRWIELTDYPVFDKGGSVVEIQSVGYDITEREIAEAKLRASNMRFRSLFEQTNDAVIILDLNGNHIEANKRAEEMLGYDKKELINLSYKDVSCELEKSEKVLQQLLGGKKVKPFERRFKKRDGSVIYVEVNVELVKDDDGKPMHIQSVARDITLRKSREAEHKKIFDQYNIILESTQDGIFLIKVDAGKEFVYVLNNKAHQKMTGFSEDVFCGKTPDELVGKEMGEKVSSNYIRCVNEKRTVTYEETLTLSGETRTYITTLNPVFENGNIKYIVGSSSDITEKKAAELQLQRKDALQQVLLSLATELINVPLEEMDTQINKTLEKIGEYTGLDRVYVFLHDYSRKVTTNTHEWCAEGIQPEIDNLQSTPFEFFTDWLTQFSRGEEVYIPRVSDMPEKNHMKPILESQNIQSLLLLPLLCRRKNIGFVGFDSVRRKRKFLDDEINLLKMLSLMICNLVQRRNAQESLQKSQKRYKMLVENLNEVIYTIDKGAFVTYISPNIMQLCGYNVNEVLGKKFVDFLHPDDKKNLTRQFRKAISGNSGLFNFRILKKDGTSVWVSTNARPIREGSLYLGAQGALSDISEIKQYQQDLIIAKEKAQESDRFKSAFLANMSHEIRTPMNGIMGFTELLRDDKFDRDKQLEFIDIIEKSGNRMLNLINDIIDISKIEAGQMPVSISKVNVNEELEAIYSFFLPRFKKENENVNLKLSIPRQPKIISTDQNKFQSVLTNLLSNAFKFTEAGEVTIGYSTKDGKLEFFVKDTGIGIKSSEVDTLFDRFFQAEPLNTKNAEGAGLGLAITKAFVELLGGKIWVKSRTGVGTVFFFTLPDNLPGEHTVSEQSYQNLEKHIDKEQYKRYKLLLVEDDEFSAKLISQYLEDFPYRILHAFTAEDALDIYKQQTDIDIILMDIKLPGMSGLDAMRLIREDGFDNPIIAQSAYAIEGDDKKALSAGSDAYLTKPIKMTDLLDCLTDFHDRISGE